MDQDKLRRIIDNKNERKEEDALAAAAHILDGVTHNTGN